MAAFARPSSLPWRPLLRPRASVPLSRHLGSSSSSSSDSSDRAAAADKALVVTREAVGDGGGVIVTLAMNRPGARNALSRAMVDEFNAALKAVRFDPSVRAVVVASTDPRTFCAGADLKERAAMGEQEVAAFVHELRALMSSVEQLPVPTLALVEGGAFGGGLELALVCDIRLAGPQAQMGLTETSLAIIPGAGGTQRLPRLIGAARAKELVFRAKRLGPQEAFAYGIVHHALDSPEALRDECRRICGEIAANGPVAISAAKAAIQQGMQVDLATGLEIERLCYAQVIPTQDRVEGLRAFKEKRKPVYTGK